MSLTEIYQQFINDMYHTSWYEYLAVFAGIASVWYSRAENILVYPVGLINTIIYIFISIKVRLLCEATVNLYYTIMSIIGWYMWMKKDSRQEVVLHITRSSGKEWMKQVLFFLFFYTGIFFALTYFKTAFFEGVIPWADAFASATAFTGMWLMTKKKVESWYWWIATNIASVPLYFVKHYVFTSVYYVVLLVMAVAGLIEWTKKAKTNNA
ncbi:MAG: nicotinamide mononucleotide transporter [Chitinophagaceae bacterium]|nr:nicotinamide mononucleotide transporter [Chitinophagaceae bacterium]